ncbi:MAG: PIG-L family deacetylase [Thermomicrobium sp.]|nr:PIG-L family deacetylase [Thermomicrobium sp.]
MLASGTSDPSASALFLSPHFDDVPLSCGGTVALFGSLGIDTIILTLFGGEPRGPLTPFARQQHRWRGLDDTTVIRIRRNEELAAAAVLGATARWLDYPDAIYRDARYTSDDELFGPIHPDDAGLLEELADEVHAFLEALPKPVTVFAPLAIGNHVDHQLARAVGQRLADRGFVVWCYEDLPYAATVSGRATLARFALHAPSPPWIVPLTEELFERRIAAIDQYRSQLAFIFRDLGDVEATLRRYAAELGDGGLTERFWSLNESDRKVPFRSSTGP